MIVKVKVFCLRTILGMRWEALPIEEESNLKQIPPFITWHDEMGSTTNGSRGQPQANSSIHYVASTSTNIRQRSDSNLQEREFKNPIYGDAERSGEVVYAAPFENRDRNESEEEHKFYNPIYGADDGENAYSVPCD